MTDGSCLTANMGTADPALQGGGTTPSPCPQSNCPYTDRDQCGMPGCPQRFKRTTNRTPDSVFNDPRRACRGFLLLTRLNCAGGSASHESSALFSNEKG